MTSLFSPVGSHVKAAGGLARGAFAFGQDIGAEAVQVFAGNPRGWALTAGDPEQDKAFRSLCASHGVRSYVHTPYLVNLGSPTASTVERSVASVRHNLARGASLGASGVVVHTGSCVSEGGYDAALRQVREALLPVLDSVGDSGPALLLEPTAGQGRSLCAGVADLPAYLSALDWHPAVGICLDTCHVFAAGAPLDEVGGMSSTLDLLVSLAGAGRLQLVHGNDSKDPRGSYRDRHERIGQGCIGEQAFTELFVHPAMAGVPVILETPGGKDAYAEDIALLKKLRG